jgi:prepilin-type N-terminal cleavage/methylation domain-containing protein
MSGKFTKRLRKLNKRLTRKRTRGFTIIELLAAVIILGIILIIAVPAVTKYLDDSRSSSYVTTAKNIMSATRVMVNSGKFSFYDADVSYYIPTTCVQSENSNRSPYGDFDPAYVIVNYEKSGYSYYWVSRDEEGIGVAVPVSFDDFTEDDIVDGLKLGDIKTDQTVGARSYTYVFNSDCTDGVKKGACSVLPIDFEYTGSVQTLKIMCSGNYNLEVWGAEGGYRTSSTYSGKGGYSHGIVHLNQDDNLYIYVGGAGNTGKTAGGFNGGGARITYNGGGGATDIRINTDSLYSRVIVAGGGGSEGSPSRGGGAGGGTQGKNNVGSGCGSGGYGGTQTGNTYSNSTYVASQPTTDVSDIQANTYAGFGFGGNGTYRYSGYGGAGGGGWYGGVGTYPDGSVDDDKGGGGGSGYIYTSNTASYYPSGCLLDSSYFMRNAETISGDQPFEDPDGVIEVGHYGNGYARITYVGE